MSINTSCRDLQLLHPKILPFTRLEASAVRPSDPRPALSQRGKRNFTSVQASGISHIHCANTAYFSPLHLCTSGTCRQLHPHVPSHTHTHTQPECLFLHGTCACVCMCVRTQIRASHLFSLLNNTELPFASLHNKRGCQNVPAATLLLHSAQYCRCLD